MGGRNTDWTQFRDTWALSLDSLPAWEELQTQNTTMDPLDSHSLAYDPLHDTAILFGGYSGGYSSEEDRLWQLPLSTLTWAQLFAGYATGLPLAVRDACGVYDSHRDRLEEFGGNYCASATSTCSTQGMSWFQFADPAVWLYTADGGAHPYPRHGAAGVYHACRDEFLLFGGQTQYTCTGTCFTSWNDAHTLQLWNGTGIWQPLATTGTPPAGRAFHTLVHDTARDRLLVYGGTGSGVDGTLWAPDLTHTPAGWSAVAVCGAPPGRSGHGAIYDPLRDEMVVVGGVLQSTGARTNEVWALALGQTPAAWRLVVPLGAPPEARSGFACIYDADRDRLVVFGGQGNAATLQDTWALPLNGAPAWQPLQPGGVLPPARTGLVALYDPTRSRMVIEGGSTGTANIRDTWALIWDRAVSVRVGPATEFATTLRLFDARGRCVWHVILASGSAAVTHLTLPPTPAGIYLLEARQATRRAVMPVVAIR